MVEKFVLVTRGSTGTTAILDELRKSRTVLVTQELFLHYTFTEEMGVYYKLVPPFDLWKQQGLWWKRLIRTYSSDSKQAHKNRHIDI
jgi:hypothetical protein